MFCVNDTVSYGTNGVCKIVEISEISFSGEKNEYYVLKPIYNQTSTFFVPTGNELLCKRMRRVLSVDEIDDVISSVTKESPKWEENEKKRREIYREILSAGDRKHMIGCINAIHQRKHKKSGKVIAADEHFLHEAEKLLYDEFAHVLNIKRDAVIPYILNKLGIHPEEEAVTDEKTGKKRISKK